MSADGKKDGITRRELFAFWRRRPEPEEPEVPAAPRMPRIPLIDSSRCVAFLGQFCDDCNRACPVPATILFNIHGSPRVDPERCIGCGECEHACPTSPPAIALPADC